MDTTDRTHRLGLPYLANDQAQKHVTVNEGLRALDALVHTSVLSAVLDSQPMSPAGGNAYLMTAARAGDAWTSFADGDLAVFEDGAWRAVAPVTGMTVWVQDEARHRVWDGAAWIVAAAEPTAEPSTPQVRADQFGINADADETNRLTLKSDAVLHSHDDVTGQGSGDARHVINKAADTNTASLVFQSAYQGRAEFGLAGSNDFSIKVASSDGTFRSAIVVDSETGAVTMPNTPTGTPTSGTQPNGPFYRDIVFVNGGAVGNELEGNSANRILSIPHDLGYVPNEVRAQFHDVEHRNGLPVQSYNFFILVFLRPVTDDSVASVFLGGENGIPITFNTAYDPADPTTKRSVTVRIALQ